MQQAFKFGSYLVASNSVTDKNNKMVCESGEIALVFSNCKNPPPTIYDLLFESGATTFDLDATIVENNFSLAYYDPHMVIDGCSTNDGWAKAKANIASDE